ncbi:MAG: hypothetical protein QOD74_204 [Variibacter sp.]|jgi:hypothetical protein|nr:hypothetical protein [Variibacter sp.]
MVNKSGLKAIGWVFGATTAFVILVAAVLVGDAIASGTNQSNLPTITIDGQ